MISNKDAAYDQPSHACSLTSVLFFLFRSYDINIKDAISKLNNLAGFSPISGQVFS